MNHRARQRGALPLVPAGMLILIFATAAGAKESVRVEVLNATPGNTLLRVTLEEFTTRPVLVDGDIYWKVLLEDEGYLKTVGSPELPHVCRSVEIPDAARTTVRVVRSRAHELPGKAVVPSRGAIPRSVDPDSVPYTFGPIYEQDVWYPPEVATHRDPFILRDVRGMVLELNLFQYNPARRTLRVTEEIEVEVLTVGLDTVNILDRSGIPARPDRNFAEIYDRHFLNHETGVLDAPESGDMLVLSHAGFLGAMQPFVDWKNAIGINTTIVDIATVGTTPSSIKSYITNLYNTSNLAYVLLVGDAAQITSPTYMGGFSDPSYSTITPDWYPDLFVGRFSAQTVAHVETQVSRTIRYEQSGHDLWLGGWDARAMGIASDEGPGHYGEFDNEHMELIRNQFLDCGFDLVQQVYEPTATKANIKSGLENGRRIVNYCGHGGTTSWGTTGWNNSDIANLANDNLLPIIHSVACVNGDFSVGTCFAEAWLRATQNDEPTGAVAAYMSSIDQYWDEPMYAQSNHGVGGKYAYVDLLAGEAMWSIGALWFAGSCTMMDLCGQWGRDMFMTWHIFGDPSLCVFGEGAGQTLVADAWAVPVTTPSDTHFTIKPGIPHADDFYLLLGGSSGVAPGTPLPQGVVLPLNVDAFTDFVLVVTNSSMCQGFFGTLDGTGEATATLSTNGLAPMDPGVVGSQLHFAAIVWPAGQPVEHATNPRMLTLVP